ncbi:RNA polymerase sigma-I factor [Bacillus sp. 2205SS5-2]|uniref:RNA polymerase sigma-I factor n=1 Tax=Bacillus sp. 2205SS5-2 TaxID=3109031 RepID=UPI00300787B2
MLNVLLLLLTRKKKSASLEQLVLDIQKGNESALEDLLQSYQPFIKKTVSSVCKRYIYESDDEFSIGLMAFHDAILKYQPERGASLLSFAEVIIKRKVIDYLRKQNKDNVLVSLDNISILEQEGDTYDNPIENSLSLRQFESEKVMKARQEEIVTYKTLLSSYKLTFEDLIIQSPKHEDARLNAIHIAKMIAKDPKLLSVVQEKKRLPMKELVERVNVSRKTIERNRKFIIAVTLILTEEFYYLRDYLKGRLNT